MSADLTIYFNRDNDATIAVCSQKGIMSYYLDFYIESGVEEVPHDSFNDMKILTSFCCAYAFFLPDDIVFGCTVSLPEKERKLFCVFDMGNKTFVARSHKWTPKEFDEKPRIAVQKISQAEGLDSISMVDCDSDTGDEIVSSLIERYFGVHGNSQYTVFQKEGLFFVVESNEINRDSANTLLKNDIDSVLQRSDIKNEYDFLFKCGCDKSRIADIFSVVSESDLDYLFEKGSTIELECPRCGFKYIFSRGDIEKD